MVFSRLPHRSAAAAEMDGDWILVKSVQPRPMELDSQRGRRGLGRATQGDAVRQAVGGLEFVREVEQSTGNSIDGSTARSTAIVEALRKR
jgi:hypothetical protein